MDSGACVVVIVICCDSGCQTYRDSGLSTVCPAEHPVVTEIAWDGIPPYRESVDPYP
jgi:hypothetical protein